MKSNKRKNYTVDREAQKAEIEKFSAELAEGIKTLRTSEGYMNMLATMAKFPTYSLRNTMMIFLQNPAASMVCGFSAWKKLGRFVKKGEKGLRIWAPIVGKAKEEDEEETEKKVIHGFRLISVFDISQTEGEPIEDGTSFVQNLEGNVEGFSSIMKAIKKVAAFPVVYDKLPDGVNGLCSYREKLIKLAEGLSEAQQIETLVHETAHSLLHGPGVEKSRSATEVEADSVAYIVCRHFGIDASPKSVGYVATWAGSMDDEELAKVIGNIQTAAAKIIGGMEKALAPKAEGEEEAA